MKDKSIKIMKTNLIEVNYLDKSSSLSSRLFQLDNTQGNPLNGSDKENEEENEEDYEDHDVAQMTNTEARQMFDDEVTFSCSSICI